MNSEYSDLKDPESWTFIDGFPVCPTGRVPGKYHSWNRWGRVGESGQTKFVSFPGAKFVVWERLEV